MGSGGVAPVGPGVKGLAAYGSGPFGMVTLDPGPVRGGMARKEGSKDPSVFARRRGEVGE
jgi:hypothetical protein